VSFFIAPVNAPIQGIHTDPKSLAAFGPGDARRTEKNMRGI